MPRFACSRCRQLLPQSATGAGLCASCRRVQRNRGRDRDRAGSSERGYDAAWERLRIWQLHREPTCRICRGEGRLTGATVVDHIIPFKGRGDPLRLDPANLQSLCKPCHDAKTARDGSWAGPATAKQGEPHPEQWQPPRVGADGVAV